MTSVRRVLEGLLLNLQLLGGFSAVLAAVLGLTMLFSRNKLAADSWFLDVMPVFVLLLVLAFVPVFVAQALLGRNDGHGQSGLFMLPLVVLAGVAWSDWNMLIELWALLGLALVATAAGMLHRECRPGARPPTLPQRGPSGRNLNRRAGHGTAVVTELPPVDVVGGRVQTTTTSAPAPVGAEAETEAQQQPAPQYAYPAEPPAYRFADVAGMEAVKQRLLEVAQEILGTTDRAGRLRNGILLYGEPGNGKTFFAEALAGELMPFHTTQIA